MTDNGRPLMLAGEQNPFLRYRERLDSYAAVRTGELTDQR